MFAKCTHAENMAKMIQLRHVPEDLHRKLKARAAMTGMSLSDYLIREIKKVAEVPTAEEIRQRLMSRGPVKTSVSPAQAIREERDRR